MEGPGRIVVVSADVGAGHDTAAAELTRRLRGRGFVVDRLNLLEVLPRPVHWAFRETYRGLLRWLPWSYELLFAVTSRSRMSVSVLRALLRPVRRRMCRAIPPDTRAVVTTYPFANQLLGPLRRQGRLAVPVITYVTDFVVHPTWLSPGVDVYCALRHAEVQPAGADAGIDVTVVQPLVSRAFSAASATGRRQARQRFGLPPHGRLALIVAGAWGVGDVENTVAEVAGTGCVRPVVVCGRNEALRHRLRQSCEHVFGWVDDMPTLMRAVDVLVENAGGLTCQEALACGVPVVTYRPLPGHGRANASILARSGLTRWVPTSAQLRPALDELTDGDQATGKTSAGPAGTAPRIDPAGLVADVASRTGHAGAADRRRRSVVDSLGDAVAVVAALLQAPGGTGSKGR
ncbi:MULTISPECIES: glycosyltransferase [Micromonospora]|uniref:UDP-N-acetylglucosamine--LPS N-acetylglucosamine transferase n=1 Tax=Micromonospora sicca TaxID=2202420 RepID=A0A317CVS3_9ACTN|nr:MULTISPECIES: glycosyltransferase [unclassified Micromonospora]MBM0227727.1 glycosyltransferase [Micromonospora sp. ATA51]PWR06292.1 UDP-N-acetylglucosamine--LPS N-acetylglucosamine transferase [Micromonospora sp. 4G51]